MRKIRVLVCIFCIFCLLLPFSGCKGRTVVQEESYYQYFDTVSVIYSYAGDSKEDFEKNCHEIEGLLEKYHRLLDIYNEYEGINNLYTLNENAGGEPIRIDRELTDFLLYAKELYAVTEGKMNVMMGSVLSLWHDCRVTARENPQKVTLPERVELEQAALYTSIELLEIDEEKGTVRISAPEASVDAGALGKGYVAERIAEHLAAKGVSGYVLDLGGNLRIVGTKPDGGNWITGVKAPDEADGYAIKLSISDTSCVTSGNYERYFELDGVRYHHIIDPDTLMPATYVASVTVICQNSALADALSTALFCMSVESGKSLVEGLDGVEAVWITPEGEQIYSSGVDAMLVK